MTQNDQKDIPVEAQLCTKCKEMYGSKMFDDMCSVCYKLEQAKIVGANKEKEKEAAETPQSTPLLKPAAKEPPASPKRERTTQETPQIKGRCSTCNRKVGMLGYECKHCRGNFCRNHRLPQQHSCEVDFITLGRKQIKSDNPVVSKKKLQQI